MEKEDINLKNREHYRDGLKGKCTYNVEGKNMYTFEIFLIRTLKDITSKGKNLY